MSQEEAKTEATWADLEADIRRITETEDIDELTRLREVFEKRYGVSEAALLRHYITSKMLVLEFEKLNARIEDTDTKTVLGEAVLTMFNAICGMYSALALRFGPKGQESIVRWPYLYCGDTKALCTLILHRLHQADPRDSNSLKLGTQLFRELAECIATKLEQRSGDQDGQQSDLGTYMSLFSGLLKEGMKPHE